MNFKKNSLGIMVNETKGMPPFLERLFCKNLCIIGRKYGVEVFVFTLKSLLRTQNAIIGYNYSKKKWIKKIYPIPTLVYDRAFYCPTSDHMESHRNMKRYLVQHNAQFIGNGLKGKWDVYNWLNNEPSLKPFLPPTSILTGKSQLLKWLDQYHEGIFIKPHSGSQGRKVLQITFNSRTKKLIINGRDAFNNRFTKHFTSSNTAYIWIKSFINQRKYIIQPYLQLTTQLNEPFDIRVLTQKNGEGKWHVTGMAVRIGKSNALTSNLHGGGQAQSIIGFLEQQFGIEVKNNLLKELTHLSNIIPAKLEYYHGQLVELGMDFGIDTQGHIWLLEVNSKPGRSVFKRINDTQTAYKSIENPIAYARYLLSKT